MNGNIEMRNKLVKLVKAVALLFLCIYGGSALCKNYTPDDSVKIMRLLKNADDSTHSNPGKSLPIAVEGIKRSEQKDFKYGIAYGLNLKAYLYALYSKTDSGLYFYKEALQICRENNFLKLEASVYSHLGRTYNDIGDNQNAAECYKQALNILKTNTDSMVLGNVYFNFGYMMLYINNYEDAEKYFLQALNIFSAIHARHDYIATLYNSLGLCYFAQKKYTERLTYVRKSIHISDSLNYKECLTHAYSALSDIYFETHNVDSALFYNLRALSLSRELNDSDAQAIHLLNRGSIYEEIGNTRDAKKYYLEGNKYAVKSINTLAQGLDILANLYAKEKEYKPAYEFRTKEMGIKDSLFNKEKLQALSRLAAKFETGELETKNEALKKEADLQMMRSQRKNLFIYGAFSALFVFILIGTLLMRQSKLKANGQRIELEQKQLRAQMNPHFIFNCLNSIQHFVVANDVKNANKYLSGFAALMRQTLENSKEEAITLRKELAYIENYLSLELMRFEDRFTYEINCSENINPDTVEIPPMIIQPFIENAIRHGLCYLVNRRGRLKINFYFKGGYLFCEIDDNGIGREQSNKLRMASDVVYESQGMELTRQRLALVSKSSGSEYEIEITDKKNMVNEAEGTTVTIKFPINQ